MKTRIEKNKLSEEEKGKAALKLLKSFDWKLFKKQREHLQFLQRSNLMPEKTDEVLTGLDNGFYDLAAFAADYLGEKETDVLLVEPEHKSQKASAAWHKKNNAYCDAEIKKIVDGISKKVSRL